MHFLQKQSCICLCCFAFKVKRTQLDFRNRTEQFGSCKYSVSYEKEGLSVSYKKLLFKIFEKIFPKSLVAKPYSRFNSNRLLYKN